MNRATQALLDEYQKSIRELIFVIHNISDQQLCKIVDHETQDQECRSIQTILTHVIASGYSYTVYIEHSIGIHSTRPEPKIFETINPYITALTAMFEYCVQCFKLHPNVVIEEHDPLNKINVKWGQQYDIEQLMEHAIVHILRHRRQIEHFIFKLSEDRI